MEIFKIIVTTQVRKHWDCSNNSRNKCMYVQKKIPLTPFKRGNLDSDKVL